MTASGIARLLRRQLPITQAVGGRRGGDLYGRFICIREGIGNFSAIPWTSGILEELGPLGQEERQEYNYRERATASRATRRFLSS
jgi:hypothetical protein